MIAFSIWLVDLHNWSLAGPLRKDHAEEDRRLPAPILPQRVPQGHDIGTQPRLQIADRLVELRLLYEGPGDVHNSIIARSGGAWIWDAPQLVNSNWYQGP